MELETFIRNDSAVLIHYCTVTLTATMLASTGSGLRTARSWTVKMV